MRSFQLFLLSLFFLVDIGPTLAEERAINKSIESPVKARTNPLIRNRQERSSKTDSSIAADQIKPELSSEREDKPKRMVVNAWLSKLENPHFNDNLSYLLSLHSKGAISIERINILVSGELNKEELAGIAQLAQIRKRIESGKISSDKADKAFQSPLSKIGSHQLSIRKAGFRAVKSVSETVPWGEIPQLQWKKGEEKGQVSGSKKLKSLIGMDGEPLKSPRVVSRKKEERAPSKTKYKIESFVLDIR